MDHTDLIIDRRSRPVFGERRDDDGKMPAMGIRGRQIVRSVGGRRDEDPTAHVWPSAAPWMKANQPVMQGTPTLPYRMASGQLIGG